MSRTKQLMDDLTTSISEIAETATATKGPKFSNALLGLFESTQAMLVLGSIASQAKAGGVNVDGPIDIVTTMLCVCVSRLLQDFSPEDQVEITSLAKDMAERHRRALSEALAGLGGKGE